MISGHDLLADWFFLIAAVLFAAQALLALTKRPDPTGGALIGAGLTLMAVAFWVT